MMRKLKWMENYPHKLCMVASIITGFSCCLWKCERDSGCKKRNCLLVFYYYLYTTTIISWWIQWWLMVTSPAIHDELMIWDCVSNNVKVLTSFFCSIYFLLELTQQPPSKWCWVVDVMSLKEDVIVVSYWHGTLCKSGLISGLYLVWLVGVGTHLYFLCECS
jgi:hypothetical protein